MWAVRSAMAATLLALTVSMAFGGCSSLPDIHFDADAAAVPPGEGGATEGGVDPTCRSTGPEVCNDGIDNDCNGKTDCQDLACGQQGFSCQDVPNGWTAVAFSATTRPSCPDGTTAVDLKVSAGDGMTAACSCSCMEAGGSCTKGSFTVTSASDVACTTTPTTTTVPVSGAACTALGADIALSTHAMIAGPSAPTSCTLTTAVEGALTDGRLCRAQAGASTGGGCGTNQTCTRGVTQGLASCITMDGKAACPATFPKRSTAGTDATDGRSCTGCGCAAPAPCTGGSVSLFDSAMCKTNGNFMHADNIGTACNPLAPGSNFTATFFKSTPPTGGGCGVPTGQGNVTGGVTFTNERTVCCR
jgi:hypothetical protein